MKELFSKRNIITAIVSLIIGILLACSCERDVDIPQKTKTIVKVVERIDTLVIKERIVKPKTVYVNKTTRDTVYVSKPNDSIDVIKANKYNQRIVGDRSVADVEVVTTGELIDLKAMVTVKDSIIEKETVIYKNKSKIFMSSELGINTNQTIRDFSVGVDYNVKNKVILGVNGGWDFNTNQPFVGLRVGIGL